MSTVTRLVYSFYNMNTCKMEQEYLFPIEPQSFLGRADKEPSLHNCDEVIRLIFVIRYIF